MAKSGLSIQVYGGSDPWHIADDTGRMPVTGEVFSQIDITRPQPVNRTVSQTNLRFSGKGDDILTPWR